MEQDNLTKTNALNNEKDTSSFKKELILEIIRFLIVGGLATLIEWGIAFLITALPLEWKRENAQIVGTTIGFSISLVINYFLNLFIVYKNKKNENSGKSLKDFLVFVVISLLVLGFQLLFIYLVNDLLFVKALKWEAIIFNNLTWGYIITKMFATVVGLVVNYILRKIFIFK